jgi:hypothetical protein
MSMSTFTFWVYPSCSNFSLPDGFHLASKKRDYYPYISESSQWRTNRHGKTNSTNSSSIFYSMLLAILRFFICDLFDLLNVWLVPHRPNRCDCRIICISVLILITRRTNVYTKSNYLAIF